MSHASLHRLLALVTGACLAATGPMPRAAAQENEQILARMEYARMRLHSGGRVDLAVLMQSARREVLALAFDGAAPMSLLDTRWRPIGPERVRATTGDFAGRVSTIAVHPTDPAVIYIGGAQGGVWRTDNGGSSWTPLTDGECSLAMGSIAIDPVDPGIVYAGTGEQHFSGDSYYGCGVLRSLDGGQTWEQLGADIFVRRTPWTGQNGMGTGGARISRMLVDRATAGSASSTTVLAATTFGLFRSTSSGLGWTLVLDGIATELVAHPHDPSVLYAGIFGEGVYRSSDGGVSWTHLSPGFAGEIGRVILAVAPSSPEVVYAGVVHGLEDTQWGDDMWIFRTADGGETWEQRVAEDARCFSQCWYDFAIAVHPLNADRVFLGTIDLYESTDGAMTFTSIRPDHMWVDQHAIVFDTLLGPDAIYVANDGGVYRSTNAGADWESRNGNLAVTQFYRGVSLHPSDPAVALGGTQDQGTVRSAGTTIWTRVLGGDGGYTAFDAEDPDVWYAETQWLAGRIGGPVKNGSLWRRGIDGRERAVFLPPLVMDPVDSRRLYFGTERIYRSDNSAGRWEPIYEHAYDSVVTAIAPSPADAATVYAAIRYGTTVATHDGGETWHESTLGLPDRFLGDIAAHPDDPDQAYVVAGGFLSGHVFQTTDGGRSWQDRTGDLPDHPVNAVIYDPADPDGVYIGTDFGVFHSASGGGAWTRLQDGLPVAAVYALAAQPGTGRLVAATHGRGMFEVPITAPLRARVRPLALVDTIMFSDTMRVADTAIVAPFGQDDFRAGWSASSEAPWLIVPRGEGRGRGRFGFQIAAAELPSGDHEGTVQVRVAGVADPLTIPVSLHIPLASRIAVAPTGPARSVLLGSKGPFPDSAVVTFSGPRPATPWSARHDGGHWLELATASGAGDGAVTWTIDAEGLEVGVYVDTVIVSAAYTMGSPAMVVDSFVVEPPLGIVGPRRTGGFGVAGWSLVHSDSLVSGVFGFGADSAIWTAAGQGSGWLSFERASGSADETIVWTRSARSLSAGDYVDTVTVRVEGRPEVSGLIVDRFGVVEEIGVEDAALHLLGLGRLAVMQEQFLEWFGNRDGTFNAGDVLRWLDHCAEGRPGSGCAAASLRAGDAPQGDRVGRRP